MPKTNRIFVFVGIAVYAILFILISLFVFFGDDESRPIGKIFEWGHLIPVTTYSICSLWVSFGLFLLLKKIFTHFFPNHVVIKIVSFALSLVIGIPAGLILLGKTIRLITA
jgi:hypothetical protein